MKTLLLILTCSIFASSSAAKESETLTPSKVLAAASDNDWRTLDQANLIYLSLASGVVIFELAPEFAPKHIENLRKLTNDTYFDDLAIIRSQDNYVAQWGDPNAETDKAKSIGKALSELEPEFYRSPKGLKIS